MIDRYTRPEMGRIWTDENGKYVGSGIYLLVAYDEEADKITTSKFAVIR